MKAKTYDGVSEAEVHLQADGCTAEEFFHKREADGAFCSWVPVNSGQVLSVDCRFSCTYIWNIRMDFIVDGILRNSSKDFSTGSKFTHTFRSAYYMEHGRVQASMIVDDLTRTVVTTTATRSESLLGTVEIRFYVQEVQNQEFHIQTVPTFKDSALSKSNYTSLTTPIIQPTQEIRFVRYNSRTTSREWAPGCHKRVGSRPWATFRFYYRTRGGCEATLFESLLTLISTSCHPRTVKNGHS